VVDEVSSWIAVSGDKDSGQVDRVSRRRRDVGSRLSPIGFRKSESFSLD